VSISEGRFPSDCVTSEVGDGRRWRWEEVEEGGGGDGRRWRREEV